ncbi:hypothetical protein D3C72_2460050 [compost metagenome]
MLDVEYAGQRQGDYDQQGDHVHAWLVEDEEGDGGHEQAQHHQQIEVQTRLPGFLAGAAVCQG